MTDSTSHDDDYFTEPVAPPASGLPRAAPSLRDALTGPLEDDLVLPVATQPTTPATERPTWRMPRPSRAGRPARPSRAGRPARRRAPRLLAAAIALAALAIVAAVLITGQAASSAADQRAARLADQLQTERERATGLAARARRTASSLTTTRRRLASAGEKLARARKTATRQRQRAERWKRSYTSLARKRRAAAARASGSARRALPRLRATPTPPVARAPRRAPKAKSPTSEFDF